MPSSPVPTASLSSVVFSTPPQSKSVVLPNSAPLEDLADPADTITSLHHLKLIRDLVDNGQIACALAWLELAKTPLSIQALATAVAISTNPGCHSIQQLKECRPKFDEDWADNFGSTSFEVVDRELYFKNCSVKDILAHDPLPTNFKLSQREWTEFSLAKACVAFLSLDDFREYPLRGEIKGRDWKLSNLHPFLPYAASYWHKHVQSVEDAALLQPRLDKIIDPAQNHLYLWTDQSGSSSDIARKFFRSRHEVAIKKDIPWLALYLLDSTSSEAEDMFPARDLNLIARHAPRVLELLLRDKAQYYLPVITKKLLVETAWFKRQSFMLLQKVLYESHLLQLPSALLKAMAAHEEGDQIFDSLFSSLDNVPVTHKMLSAAASNGKTGLKILQLFFRKVPGLRVDSAMLYGAVSSHDSHGTLETLQFLLDHDGGIHVTEDILLAAVNKHLTVDRLQLLLEAWPHTSVPSKVIENAVRYHRLEMVKYIFENDKDVKVSKELLEAAVYGYDHELGVAQYVLDRCDESLITQEILLSATQGLNSADKMVKLLWHYKKDLEITDEILIASTYHYSSELTDWLLDQQERHELPHEVVDRAVGQEKASRRLALQIMEVPWVPNDDIGSSLLKVLQRRVPNDPYLKKVLAETDFSPPAPKSSEEHIHHNAVPNAARYSDLVKLIDLLDKGADIDGRTATTCGCDRNKGVGTALQRAVKQHDIEMVKLLIDRGANLDIQEGDYGNPLQEASKAGDLELVQLLVEHKAIINHRGGRYRNPLTAAARANDVKIVQFLIEHGADTNIADDNGWTPYLWAVASESHDVVRFLQSWDPSICAIGELIALWPMKLKDHASVEMGEDRLSITTDTTDVNQLSHCISLCTDQPILPTMPFYFEMTVVRLVGKGAIAVGFAKKPHNSGMPGKSNNSWAYHGNDGHIYDEGDRHIVAPYPTYGAGDVVGCGVDFASKTAYFTKNGERLGTAFCMISGQLFPVIGVGERGTELRVNLGEEPFVYQV